MVVTNMWGNVDPETGASREEQLAAESVKPAPDKDVQLLRHYNTTESAHDIIRAVLRNRQTVPEVQQELVDERGCFLGQLWEKESIGGRRAHESARAVGLRVGKRPGKLKGQGEGSGVAGGGRDRPTSGDRHRETGDSQVGGQVAAGRPRAIIGRGNVRFNQN